MKKLTKAQQALLNRLKAGEEISKNWMGRTFRDSKHNPINKATWWSLYMLDLVYKDRRGDWEYLVLR